MQLFLHAVFVIACSVMRKQYIRAQDDQHSGTDIDQYDSSRSIEQVAENIAHLHEMHNHTFVALLDIVFTDDTKRTCTGTIIHDNVVITARHCFGKTNNKYLQPEISASFIVIGSRKMFEIGNEQYLPIERIVSHPNYKGWTADIALIYTFANMMSDKPGTILPLAGDKISIPNNSNVTILSWGRSKDSEGKYEQDNGYEDWKKFTKYPLRANPFLGSGETSPSKSSKIKKSKTPKPESNESKKPKAEKIKRTKTKKQEERKKKDSTKPSKAPEGTYRSQTLSVEYTEESSAEADYVSEGQGHKLVHDPQKHYGSIFKGSRRNMESENNELAMVNFKFVNLKTCADMMKRSLPEKYKIKNPNEFVCYSNEDHFVTDEDAGAPAVRHGHLIAVTVGGVDCDGEQIAVGIKMSCFCNWIADNLPNNKMHLKCCNNCCEEDKTAPEDDNKDDDDYIDETNLRMQQKKKVKKN